jgi:N-acetylneuraminic acid mutarotase
MTVHEVYDPASDSWHTAAPLPTGRNSVAGAVLNGQFVVIGGEDGAEQQVYSEVEAYDPSTDTWTALPPVPQPMQGTGAAVTDGRLFLPGGGPTAGGTDQSTLLQVLTVPQ